MWTKSEGSSGLLFGGFILSTLVYISQCMSQECHHEIWDEATAGKGVKRLQFTCATGRVEWHGPYGGLFVHIKGPSKEHQLCIQAHTFHTAALINIIEPHDGLPRRLMTLNNTANEKLQPKHMLCFPASNETTLFIEPDIGAFVSSKIILEYDVEENPRYGDDACRPCTDEELLYYYCTSDFVAIGQMTDLKLTSSVNIIPVSLDLIKQQSTKYFTRRSKQEILYTGQLYTPSQCKLQYGKAKFVFMGKIKFNRAELRCAPTYDDFRELQRTSKLKGMTLCT